MKIMNSFKPGNLDEVDKLLEKHKYKRNRKLASLVAQTVKNLPALLETWVWSLGWRDPLEKGMATYSNIFALENSMDGMGRLQSMMSQKSNTI